MNADVEQKERVFRYFFCSLVCAGQMVFDLDHKRVCNPVLEGTSGLSVYDSGEVVCAYRPRER